MRILQVSPFLPAHGGGIEVVAMKLAEAFGQTGDSVVWLAGAEPGHAIPELGSRVAVIGVPFWDPLSALKGLPLPIWGWGGLHELWRQLDKCEVVHVHDYLYQPSLMAILFAKLRRKPVVLTQHIGDLPLRSRVFASAISVLNRTLGKLVLGCVDRVAFVSKAVSDYFAGFVTFDPPAEVVSNGVDHDVYRPGGCREGDVVADVIRLIFVGRFVEKKGIQHLRGCLDLPGVRWTFVGNGPLSPKEWPELPATARVVSDALGADVVPYYQESDLLVLPSFGEGFPLVVQEALACGVPVLVESAVAEACPNRDPACVFEVDLASEPEQAVRKALHDLLRDRSALRRARLSALRLSRQWSWKATASRYRAMYRELAGLGQYSD